MKVFSVFHHGNEITIHNNLMGVESICYNDVQQSRKYSTFGGTHTFSIQDVDGFTDDFVVEIGYGWWGVTCNVWCNNEPLFIGLKNRARKRFKRMEHATLV